MKITMLTFDLWRRLKEENGNDYFNRLPGSAESKADALRVACLNGKKTKEEFERVLEINNRTFYKEA